MPPGARRARRLGLLGRLTCPWPPIPDIPRPPFVFDHRLARQRRAPCAGRLGPGRGLARPPGPPGPPRPPAPDASSPRSRRIRWESCGIARSRRALQCFRNVDAMTDRWHGRGGRCGHENDPRSDGPLVVRRSSPAGSTIRPVRARAGVRWSTTNRNGIDHGHPRRPHPYDGDDEHRRMKEDTHTERRGCAGAGSPARRSPRPYEIWTDPAHGVDLT